MKKTLRLLTLVCACFLATSLHAKIAHLLPKPQVLTQTGGAPFSLARAVRIVDAQSTPALQRFVQENAASLTTDASAPAIIVERVASIPGTFDHQLFGFDNETYKLTISADEVRIEAVTETGVIRAVQTLAQLAEGYEGAKALEACTITDWPAFKLRGVMHDVGRSFISIAEIKKNIDLLSRFKINVFHWHMTENQAWRFEVKAYPQLTSAASMTRFAGQYYTQAQCREVVEYAKECGVMVIPEIDMPGHSEAFVRAMGHDMQTDQGMKELQVILEEVAAVFHESPYIHFGGDEHNITYPNFLNIITDKIHALGKKAIAWNPLRNKGIDGSTGIDMTEMWSTGGRVIKGMPNIDCRYNYTNHFDVFADLAGIYRSNIYYEPQGTAEVAGFIQAYWNDRKMPTELDIIKQNNFYANALASAERAWIGGGKQYIEVGGAVLPNSGEEYDEFLSWETRFLFHKAHSLKNEPIPYVKQTNVRWEITDPFPNNGNVNMVFPPETEGIKDSYTYNGKSYATSRATGAGIYLNHTWSYVPGFFRNRITNHTAYAWTYIYSPVAQEVGALIEFQNYGRSEADRAPDAGKWDREESKIWLNDQLIPPPAFQNAGKGINREMDLLNENFTARKPVIIQLKQGWNKVFIKRPHLSEQNANGVRLNKWIFTFVITDKEGKNALDGLIYSPSKSIDANADAVAMKISEMRKEARSICGDAPGYYPPTTDDAMEAFIATIEPTLGTAGMSAEARGVQLAKLDSALQAFKAFYPSQAINLPKLSTATESFYYAFNTPLRETKYPTANGNNAELTGVNPPTSASYWKFVDRGDGSFDIVNYANGSYISPASANNTALRTTPTRPEKGWNFGKADALGFLIITSGNAQFNQTTAGLGYKIYNWGSGTNSTDAGCKYAFEEVTEMLEKAVRTALIAPTTLDENGNFAPNTRWYTLVNKKDYPLVNPGQNMPFTLRSAAPTLDANNLWCFVGDSVSGYKIFNKESGAAHALVSPKNTSANTGGNAYPVMLPWKALDANTYQLLWQYESSHYATEPDGFVIFLKQYGTGYGANNRDGKLAFWTTGKDLGSSFNVHTGISTFLIDAANGALTLGKNTSFASKWTSSLKLPSLTLSHSHNNMQKASANDNLVIFDSTNGNYTFTVDPDYIITGYSFDFTASKAMTISPAAGGEAVTNAANRVAYVSASGLKDATASFQLSGGGSVELSKVYVTVQRASLLGGIALATPSAARHQLVFDLQGHRVAKPLKNHIYIVGGKKVLMK